MKRQYADVGVKYWGNEDLLELQAEPLKALDGFFAQYGPCIIQGCEITPSGDTFDVAPGLVVLEGMDHRGGTVTMIVPFEGVAGTSLPLFLTLGYQAREREYGDGKVKPIAYDYTARASTVEPPEGTACLRVTAEGMLRFVDVLGDEKHSFITDIERAVWNAKETPTGAQDKADKALDDAMSHAAAREIEIRKDYAAADANTLEGAKMDASNKAEAALRSAKDYTDAREGIVRTDMAAADNQALLEAKAYADRVVTALVDGSPEALNTLQELAAALGNDPNFAATVLTLIGEKLPKEMTFGGYKYYQGIDAAGAFLEVQQEDTKHTVAQLRLSKDGTIRFYNGKQWDVWHSGNLDPTIYMPKNFTHGILSPDEVKLTGGSFATTGLPAGWAWAHVFTMKSWSYGAIQLASRVKGEGSEFIIRSTESEQSGQDAYRPWVRLWHSGNHDPGVINNANGNGTVRVWTGTQAQYSAIASKDSNTLYFIS